MKRDARLRQIGKYAFPDHRFLPRDALEKIVKRGPTKPAKKALKGAYNRICADNQSGAGYPIDQQLREFLLEYNDRALGHGLMTMPASFNVFEGFYEFRVNFPAHFFVIRPEIDHLFSFADFLDFVTSSRHDRFSIKSLLGLSEGTIHNYTPVGDFRDLAFLHASSSRFVFAGFTMVRCDDQLHWGMIGGPICDLAEQTNGLQPVPKIIGRPLEKAFIDFNTNLEFRAEPLAGTDDVWKTVVFGRINLQSEKHEVQGFGRDLGNRYSMFIDDPEMFGVDDISDLNEDQRQTLVGMAEHLQRERLLFDIAETCFQLPAYFSHRITLIRETKRQTGIATMSSSDRTRLSAVAPTARPLFKTVTSLEIIDIGKTLAVRSYTPPKYKVEVSGFWRKLSPDAVGKDAAGNPVKGRTWVKGHLRWRDLPDRQSIVFVKSSIASAKAKAAAIVASDPSAIIVGDELPPIVAAEIEPETENAGWLYVMRCPLMEADVYKVGWSSRLPSIRAEEISKATGVAMAYIVVESWKVEDARLVEASVHEALAAWRINPKREFFKAPFEKIRAEIAHILKVN